MRKVIAPESGTPIEARPRATFSVWDDGSTEDLSIAPYRHRIEFIRKEHGGGASALNGAAASARGEFVAILDADDVYAPERLEPLGDLASPRPNLEVLGTDAWYVRGGRRVGRFNGKLNPLPAENQRITILRRCFRVAPVFRRRRLLEGGGSDESRPLTFDWVLSSAPSPVARATVAPARQEGRSRAASRKKPE